VVHRDPPDDAAAAASMNMTPMIDVVFQLIVFLMLANDLGAREIEELDLPRAPHAEEDEPGAEKRRVIVNVLREGGPGGPALRVRGAEMDVAGLRRLLAPEAGMLRRPEEGGATDLSVLVRADRTTPWRDVQEVLRACADGAVRVHRIQFATEDPAKSVGGQSGREGGDR